MGQALGSFREIPKTFAVIGYYSTLGTLKAPKARGIKCVAASNIIEERKGQSKPCTTSYLNKRLESRHIIRKYANFPLEKVPITWDRLQSLESCNDIDIDVFSLFEVQETGESDQEGGQRIRSKKKKKKKGDQTRHIFSLVRKGGSK